MNKKYIFEQGIAALPRFVSQDLNMHALLDPAINALPELLKEGIEKWDGIYIDYEPPFLMRLYKSIDVVSLADGRSRKAFVSLHYFFSGRGDGDSDRAGFLNPYKERPDLIDKENDNNYHPHPWASAFFILKGSYKQELGLATRLGYSSEPASLIRPKPYALVMQQADNEERCSYAFNDPYQWHRVLPDSLPCGDDDIATVMITYKPEDWGQVGPKPAQKQRQLSLSEKTFMAQHFSKLLSARTLKLRLQNNANRSANKMNL